MTVKLPQKVIVDEGVGRTSALWVSFSRWLKDRPAEITELARSHPGIPDSLILDRLLQPGTILVTNDRALHNRALSDGHRSLTLTPSGALTEKPCEVMPLRPTMGPAPSGDLREDYRREPHPLTRSLRAGMSERELKGYRSRRRRIHSLFGGRDNLQQVSVTVGARVTPRQGTLCGVSLQIAGTGRKGLKATEGYSVPAVASTDPALCLIRALLEIYLLDLDDLRAEVFVIPPASLLHARELLDRGPEPARPPLHEGLRVLLRGVPRLALHPCAKGPFFDAMERKLSALCAQQTNEITVVDFLAIAGRLSGSSPTAQPPSELGAPTSAP